MTRPLENRTVALAEGRQLEELAQLLEKEGARVLRCPMVGIHDAPDAGTVEAWLGELKFIHSSSRGVKLSRMDPRDPEGGYWLDRWVGARRIIP